MVNRRLDGVLLAGLLALTGCRLASPTTCTRDDECPAGYRCSVLDSYCLADDAGVVARDGAVDAAIDAAAGDSAASDRAGIDGSSAPPCGTVQVYQDEFDSDLLDGWWPFDGSATTVAASGGRLLVEFSGGLTNGTYAGVSAQYLTDLRGNTLRIQLVDPVDNSEEASASFQFRYDDFTSFGLTQSGGMLFAENWVAGTLDQKALGTYDPATASWWQLREAAGRVNFETSADGVSWTWQHDIATPDYIDAGAINIVVGAWGGTMVHDLVAFDHLEHGLPPAAWCPASTWSDDFSDQLVDRLWLRLDSGGCQFSESSAALHLAAPAAASAYCAVTTWRGYSLIESSALAHVAAVTAQAGVSAALALWHEDTRTYWEFGLSAGQLYVFGDQAGSSLYAPADEPANNRRWLRIRHHAGALYFDARTDLAPDWTTPFTTGNTGPLDELSIGLRLDLRDAVISSASPANAHFDHYNVSP